MTRPGPHVPISEVRKAYGLTLPALSERIRALGVDVHPDALSNVERGHRQPSPVLLRAWAEALKINVLDVTQVPRPVETGQPVAR